MPEDILTVGLGLDFRELRRRALLACEEDS